MTQRNQKGFSIIELLIVVAIIAILILVALPQYQRYILRAQISEGMSLAAGPKTELGVMHAENGEFSTTVSQIPAGTGEYISAGSVTSTGTRTATIQYTFGANANAEIRGATFSVVGTIGANGIDWACTATATDVVNAMPSACR